MAAMSEDSRLPPLPSRSTPISIFSGFLLVAVAVFGLSVLNSNFVLWDDNYLVFFNPHIKAFTWSNLVYNFTHFDPELYIPLTFLSYQLDYAVAGMSAPFFHFTNLLLHTLNASLVALLLYFLLRRSWVAIFCGLLFLVHPLHTEAVMWVSARKDVLSTSFFLASLLCYLRYRSDHRSLPYWLSVLAFGVGLLAKVSIVTLPVILLLVDVLQRRAWNWKWLTEKLPHFGLAIIFGIVALMGKQGINASSTLLQKALMGAKSTVFYLEKLFLPFDLTVIYPYTDAVSAFSPDFTVPVLLVLALLGLAIFSLRFGRTVFFGFLFFLITLVPSFINFSKGGDFYFASDRYAYIPSIGILFLLASFIASRTDEGHSKRSLQWRQMWAGVLSCVIALFGWLTFAQAKTWENSEALFTQTLRLYPEAIAARLNLSVIYREAGRLDEALAQLREVIKLKEHTRAYSGMATIYEKMGRRAEAYAAYRKAEQIDPKDPEPHFGLGILYAKDGNMKAALEAYNKTLAIDPTYVGVYNNLAALYLEQKDYAKAEETYRKSVSIDPYFPDAHFNLGVIAEDLGKTEEAIAAFETTIRLDKKSVDAYVHLAPLYLKLGKKEEAINAVKKANEIDPTDEDAKFLLETFTKHGLIR